MKKNKVIPLNKGISVDYLRQHNLTPNEVRSSPVFSHLDDKQVDQVIQTYLQFCLIAMEYIENQQNMVGFYENGSHIAGEGKIIELNPSKDKAA